MAGVLLGCLTLDPVLLVLTTLFSVSVDVDHVFQVTGLSYLPRPAHSLVFPIVLIVSLWLGYRRQNLVLASSSAFIGHMALDSGKFPLLSPLYFHYLMIPDWLDPVLMVSAIALSLMCAYTRRKARRLEGNRPQEARVEPSGPPHAG